MNIVERMDILRVLNDLRSNMKLNNKDNPPDSKNALCKSFQIFKDVQHLLADLQN